MTRSELVTQIKLKKSWLCIGLDTDLAKIPKHLLQEADPCFAFNKAIIDATKDYAVSYKINTAFYEAQGLPGWVSLQKTLEYIPKECFTIADAKRGDIGNTADQYAKTFFETYPFDSVTVAPYMGADSVKPFLQHDGKWAIILALTSNPSSEDFEQQELANGKKLYEEVLDKASSWGTDANTMFVVGATKPEGLAAIRERLPNHFFLVPGVGAQGGTVAEVAKAAAIADGGLLINASRAVIYASDGKDFAESAGKAAKILQLEMAEYISL